MSMPEILLIVAQSDNRAIGHQGAMPWHLPRDLKHFKAQTLGHPVIMGRKTYDSIGRALPGRQNLVISRNAALALPDAQTCPPCAAAGRYPAGHACPHHRGAGGRIFPTH